MMLNKKQAFQELEELVNSKKYETMSPSSIQNALFEIASRTSVEMDGLVTILYSGRVYGEDAWKIASSMYETNKKDFRIINETPAGSLLSSYEFKTTLYTTAGVSEQEYKDYSDGKSSEPTKKAIKGLDHVLSNTDTLKGKLGIWSITSKRFIEYTKGKVIAIVGWDASETRVFGKIEIPTMVENRYIVSINGKTLEELMEESIKENISIETKIFEYAKDSTAEQLKIFGIRLDKIAFAGL